MIKESPSSSADPLSDRQPDVGCQIREFPDAERLNPLIRSQFEAALADPGVRRSHFFAGRFENIYVPLDRTPAVSGLLDFAGGVVSDSLACKETQVRSGFWFNLMNPGDVTLPHCHDENDELLSAVYYVTAPRNSGDLLLRLRGQDMRIRPEAGRLVLFSPAVVHEVTRNLSSEPRLSIAMNFGLV